MEEDASSLTWPAEAATAATVRQSELRRQIWGLAWPVIITFLFESLVGLVDTLMVGRLGASAVAAVGVGAQILSGVSVAMTAVGTGTLALVARHVGAGEPEKARWVLAQSIGAALALSALAVTPVIVWARPLVAAFGVEPHVTELGSAFVRLVMCSIPASAVLFVIGSALRGAGDMRTPLFIGLTVNVLNVIGNYVFIFGKLGFPALGVRGSALATTIAFAVGTTMGLVMLARGSLVLSLRLREMLPRLDPIRRILAIGYPTAAEQMLMQIGFFLYLLFAARYGTSAVAAYFIGVRILALSFLPGFGFGAAAGTLVGQNLGARAPERAERAGWLSTRLSVYLMSACGLLIFLAARPIAGLFVDDPRVIDDTVSFIYMLAIAQPLMAIDFTLGGALRGAGDTRFPLLTVLVAFYGCRLGFAFVAASVLHLSVAWLWAALIGDYIARAALKSWRFRSGRWKSIAV
jgi:putative MATE family efflux protein